MMLCGLGPTASLVEDPPTEEMEPEEECEENMSLLKRAPSRLLELPRYILEIPWYPIKHFLNFSERTDLINRVVEKGDDTQLPGSFLLSWPDRERHPRFE